MRTNRFESHPAAVAKDRIRQIVALTLRANHNGNQSQLGRIVPNSIEPDLAGAAEEVSSVYSTRPCRKQVKGLVTILMLASLQTLMAVIDKTLVPWNGCRKLIDKRVTAATNKDLEAAPQNTDICEHTPCPTAISHEESNTSKLTLWNARNFENA
jgi:hypothetical protein